MGRFLTTNLLLIFTLLVVCPTVQAGILSESRGYDAVKRSLNKRIMRTQRRTWTEYTGPGTGRSVVTRPCPIIPKGYIERGYDDDKGYSLSYSQRQKLEQLHSGAEGFRNDLVYCRRKNFFNNFDD